MRKSIQVRWMACHFWPGRPVTGNRRRANDAITGAAAASLDGTAGIPPGGAWHACQAHGKTEVSEMSGAVISRPRTIQVPRLAGYGALACAVKHNVCPARRWADAALLQ